MLPKKTLWEKKFNRELSKMGKTSVRIPERFVTPKERPGITPEESEKAFMDIIKIVFEQKLRESGNRTGKKRNRLLKRTKRMKCFDYSD